MSKKEALEKLSNKLETLKAEIDKSPGGRVKFEEVLDEKKVTGFKGGGITDRRNEMIDLIKKAESSETEENLNLENELIVSRYLKYIEVASDYTQEKDKIKLENTLWMLGYFRHSKSNIKPKTVVDYGIGFLEISTKNTCVLMIQDTRHSEEWDQYQGSYCVLSNNNAVKFDFTLEKSKSFTLISSFEVFSDVYRIGTYTRFDGVKIECGRFILNREPDPFWKIDSTLQDRFLRRSLILGSRFKLLTHENLKYTHYLSSRKDTYILGYDAGKDISEFIKTPIDTLLDFDSLFVDLYLPRVLVFADFLGEPSQEYENQSTSEFVKRFIKDLKTRLILSFEFLTRQDPRDFQFFHPDPSDINKSWAYSTLKVIGSKITFFIFMFNGENPMVDSFIIGAALGRVKHLILVYKSGSIDDSLNRLIGEYRSEEKTNLTRIELIRFSDIRNEIDQIEKDIINYLFDNL